MFPVLFSIFGIPVSSFGILITLGFLFGLFLIWRLARAWDLDEEKVLDLTLLTFLGGMIGARFFFVLQNSANFRTILDVLLIHKVPGFSFWGALLGGWLTLFFLSRAKKLDFLSIGDIASVGFLGSLIFSSFGCFLGGCELGVESKLFFAVNMVGVVGKRFPIQLIEAIFYIFILLSIWSTAVHFHTRGKILSLSLIYIGIVKLLTEPFKQNTEGGAILSFVLLLLGVTMLYKVTKRNPLQDLSSLGLSLVRFFTDSTSRKNALDRIRKSWYNKKTSFFWRLRNLKKVLRRFNVKFS